MFLLAQESEKLDDAAAVVTDIVQNQAVSGSTVFMIMLAVLFLPHVLATFIAKALKLKEFSGRIGAVLFVLTVAVTPFIYQLLSTEGTVMERAGNSFRLGIDLAGGSNLVYQVDIEKQQASGKNLSQAMDNMVAAIARRVNPSGTEEVTVRRVGSARIEIIIPGADQAYVEEMKARITRLGTLEFQILATSGRPSHRGLIKDAEELADNEDRVIQGELEVARWVDVDAAATEITPRQGEALTGVERNPSRQKTYRQTLVITDADADEADVVEAAKALAPGSDDVEIDDETVATWVDVDKLAETKGRQVKTVQRNVQRQTTVRQMLVAVTNTTEEVTGEFLNRATEEMDSQTGRMNVGFQFNSIGADRFGKLTTKYQKNKDGDKYRLAILLDGVMRSAPTILEPIYGQGRITGRFTREEVQSLVSVLNAGALDVPLIPEPVSEFTISPTLGKTVRTKGIIAIAVSAIVVIVFMGVYYLKAGLIAVACLTLNIILIMGTMVFVQGTFTLPGLAGLVLTIGMAVDANVLIFERIREEIARGASVRMAIHNGFGKAFSAIIDSNLTTLLVAIILFMIGTDQVKGFAVTLFIGIMMSMFSALYFGRLVFEVLEQKRLLKNLNMFSIVKSPTVDFVGKRKIAFVASALLILVGLATFAARGVTNLDIDFRGGTMVTFEFEEDRHQDEFRDLLEARFGQDITIEQLSDIGDTESVEEKGKRWRLRTVEDAPAKVEKGIADKLKDLGLLRISVSKGAVENIAPKKPTDENAVAKKSPYDNGSRVVITIDPGEEAETVDGKQKETGITASTIEREINDELVALKYANPTTLYRLIGTKGAGLNKDEGEVKKFDQFKVEFVSEVSGEKVDTLTTNVIASMTSKPLFAERTTFAKSVGGEMQNQAIFAMLTSLVAIIAYIWFRFQRVTFGLAAVAALLHDVLIVLGLMAMASQLNGTAIGSFLGFYDFKINLPMIAAFLTIVGYSLNDTIVIFDRIREVRGKNPALTSEMINTSLNQTLARTLLTSLTTFVVVAILYVFGGEGIHGFAFCLLVGVFVGTYSSIFVASPVLLWLMNRKTKASTA